MKLGAIAGAEYGSAAMLSIYPYQRDSGDIYGIFRHREKQPDQPRSCCVKIVSEELAAELERFYFSGGFNVEFIEQKKGDWLVSFSANNIIASCYMRLSREEMDKLFTQLT